ncbi:TPA: hypothetical protein ACK3RK_007544 [Burkholderia cepacia]
MTIEEFWNQAFLSSLTRLAVDDAKKCADEALEIALTHWKNTPMRTATVITSLSYRDTELSEAARAHFPNILTERSTER